MRTIIEPFRIKTVEPIQFTTECQRRNLLQKAGYNLFLLKAEDIIIDFLTDSGTSAMSTEQWAALMRGDESYAGCKSYYKFIEVVQRIFGFKEILPVHQGRAGERILFGNVLKVGDVVPSNTHFDTTRANIEANGALALDLPVSLDEPDSHFKGNIDILAFKKLLETINSNSIPFAMVTVTNNACGGQPVSMANLREYSELLRKHRIPLFIDAARFAENAYLIKCREPEFQNSTISEIVTEMFQYADGCLMSAKKDGLANMGGFIALKDKTLANKLKASLILTEGFPTYGGLSGRDLETIAVGLQEAMEEDYLRYRASSAEYLARGLLVSGIPVLMPPGLHAIYLDAAKFFPHIPASEFPGQVLACELYLEAGIRSCELGSVMFGRFDQKAGKEIFATKELLRLALPRRVYCQSHYDYVIEAITNVYTRRDSIKGMKFTFKPDVLRHFTAQFEPLESDNTSKPKTKEAEFSI